MSKTSTLWKLLFVVALSSSILFSSETVKLKAGKVYTAEGENFWLSPMIGERLESNGTKTAIDLRPQGVGKYYDSQLEKGISIQTKINHDLQFSVANIINLDDMVFASEDILIGVMDNTNGEMIALARANAGNLVTIKTKEIPTIKDKFADYLFEPGFVMKPITAALALDKQTITTNVKFNLHNGKMQIDKKRYITDMYTSDKNASLEDIIVHSSSIGISQVAWKLSGKEFRDGLLSFGFGIPSGIDLPYDEAGHIKSIEKLEHKMHRAQASYGYGSKVTFTQLLKAYSTFTNEGKILTPHIGTAMIDGNHTKEISYMSQQVISAKTAKEIKEILLSVVEKGTGKNAKTQGLTIGGKTSTTHIAKDGKYTNNYNSTFFGFAEDKLGHSYTIGVLVIDPKNKRKRLASQSAVPIFKKIVDEMVKDKLLVIDTQAQDNIKGVYVGSKTISPLPGGKLDKTFGIHTDKTYNIKIFNESISIKAAEKSTKVQNVLDGKVVYAGKTKFLKRVVVVAHKNKLHTVYANLSKIAPSIKEEVLIKKGYVVGRVEDRLIFEVTQDSQHINPLDLIEL